MPDILNELASSPVSLVMAVAGVAVLAYAAYLWLDQRDGLVYAVPRGAAQVVVPVALVAVAVGNYLLGGRGTEQLAAGVALVAFAALTAVARTGLGRAGIYADAVRRAWERVDEVHVGRAEGGEGTRVSWAVGQATRELTLPGVEPSEVAEFVREMRRAHPRA